MAGGAGRPVEVLLCDADGCLFPSEEPAFAASAEVTNRLLAALGIPRRFDPDELRQTTTGRSFRATALDLARAAGREDRLPPSALERWVLEEQRVVTAHLAATLRPDDAVRAPLTALARRHRLAVVSSSALVRLAACFVATGLDDLLPASVRFSAEDSLPVPTSKPDPAVYALAGRRLGVCGASALAVEDSVPGATAAIAAGFATVGLVQFVPVAERAERADALVRAGVTAVAESWGEVAALLEPPRS